MRSLPFLLALLLTVGCSSASKKHQEELTAKDKQIEMLNGQVTSLQGELKTVSDKLDAMQILFENATGMKKPTSAGVKSHPADGHGKSVGTRIAKSDPEAGFVRDEPIRSYRQATVLLEAGKTPEALLAFTRFLERYPDHALAGSAQYYIGKCYLAQNQHKAAITEFQRVLTSYDRSSHVSHTLRDLADAEEAVGEKEQAAKHRQLLNSLFPQSPAANVAASENEAPPSATGGIEGAPAARNPTPTQPKKQEQQQHTGPGLDEPPAPDGGTTPPTAPSSFPETGAGTSEEHE